jgi:hypothetical protein
MLTGEYDYLTTPEDSARTAGAIKNGRFITMPEDRALPMSEEPMSRFRAHLSGSLGHRA